MKRFTAAMTALVFALTCTACGLKTKKGATMEVDLDHSYTVTEVRYEEKGSSTLIPLLCTEDTVLLLSLNTRSAGSVLRWDPENNSFQEAELHETKQECAKAVAMPDDCIGLVYKNMSLNKEWMPESCSCWVDIYNKDMQYIESAPLDFEFSEWGIEGNTTAIDSEGRWYYSYMDGDTEHLLAYSADREKLCEFDLGGLRISRLLTGNTGDVYGQLWDINGADSPYYWYRLEPSGTLTKLNLENIPAYPNRLCPGFGAYEFCVSDDRGIYGVQLDGENGTAELLLDFQNSDFTTGYGQIVALSDGRFLLEEYDYDSYDGEHHLWLARSRSQEEKDSIQCMSLAGVALPRTLVGAVVNYNRTHADKRIVMVDYAQYSDSDDFTYAGSIDRLHRDLLTGTVPDILCTEHLPFDSLANKGLFADLGPLLKKDERFSEDAYLMNFFDSLRYGGKQQRIAFSYFVLTQTAKTEFVGTQQGRTPEEFTAMIDSLPDGMTLYAEQVRGYMENLIGYTQNAFVDTETRTCSFDSPAFVELLKLAGSMQPRDYTAEFDLNEIEYACANDKALLDSQVIGSPIRYHENHAGKFHNEDITLVGYPAPVGGNGGIFYPDFSLSLNAQSKYEQEIMDFFMELLSEEWQRSLCTDSQMRSNSLPVLRSALEEDLNEATKGAARTTYIGGNTVNTGNATEEEMAELYAYIEGITVSLYQDQTVQRIINEESEMFYAGDQTAEEAADMIQSRVQIYLSEQG